MKGGCDSRLTFCTDPVFRGFVKHVKRRFVFRHRRLFCPDFGSPFWLILGPHFGSFLDPDFGSFWVPILIDLGVPILDQKNPDSNGDWGSKSGPKNRPKWVPKMIQNGDPKINQNGDPKSTQNGDPKSIKIGTQNRHLHTQSAAQLNNNYRSKKHHVVRKT